MTIRMLLAAAGTLALLSGGVAQAQTAPATTEKNLQAIVDRVRAKYPKARLVIAGMMMPDNMGPEYTKAFRELFQKAMTEIGLETPKGKLLPVRASRLPARRLRRYWRIFAGRSCRRRRCTARSSVTGSPYMLTHGRAKSSSWRRGPSPFMPLRSLIFSALGSR